METTVSRAAPTWFVSPIPLDRRPSGVLNNVIHVDEESPASSLGSPRSAMRVGSGYACVEATGSDRVTPSGLRLLPPRLSELYDGKRHGSLGRVRRPSPQQGGAGSARPGTQHTVGGHEGGHGERLRTLFG